MYGESKSKSIEYWMANGECIEQDTSPFASDSTTIVHGKRGVRPQHIITVEYQVFCLEGCTLA